MGGKKGGNEAVIQIKGNQKTAYNQAVSITENTEPVSKHTDRISKKRNRIEQRITEVFEVPYELRQENTVFELAQIIAKVERRTEIFETKERKWKKRDKKDCISYYIVTTALSAKEMSKIIRNHWGIENRNHYVKDVVLKEDFSRIRVNAGIMARFRSFALNTLRANKSENIKGDIYLNTMNLSNCFKLKGMA